MPDLPKPPSLEDALAELPLFPLPEVVLFPHAVMPLHVFEPRYRRMLADCLATHSALAIAHIVEGLDEWGQPRISPISGGGVVLRHQPLPGGRSNILVLGRARVRLEELAPSADIPYRRARAEIVTSDDGRVSDTDKMALVGMAMSFVTEVRRHDPGFGFSLPSDLGAADVADACACQLVAAGDARQEILEELDPSSRVERVTHQLAIQLAAMKEDGVVLS
jgi:Lon protease-like protein